jgi:hypothetical protein
MTIVSQTYVYEVLVRGTPDGGLAAAHVIEARRVVDTATGEVLSEKLSDARPLDVTSVGTLVDPVLVAGLAAKTAEIATLTQELASRAAVPAG